MASKKTHVLTSLSITRRNKSQHSFILRESKTGSLEPTNEVVWQEESDEEIREKWYGKQVVA